MALILIPKSYFRFNIAEGIISQKKGVLFEIPKFGY